MLTRGVIVAALAVSSANCGGDDKATTPSLRPADEVRADQPVALGEVMVTVGGFEVRSIDVATGFVRSGSAGP